MRRVACILAAMAVCAAALSVHAQEPAVEESASEPALDPFVESIRQELGRERTAESETDAAGEISSNLFDSRVILQAIVSLIVVLALMFLVIALLRRFGGRIPALAGNELGQVMGRLHLDRATALHFVRVGPHVLVIGVTANSVGQVAVLPADDVVRTGAAKTAEKTSEPRDFDADTFLQHLRTASASPDSGETGVTDSEVTRLRSEIHRLQQFLQEETRGRNE